MAETTSRHHGNSNTARRHHGGEGDADLVTNTACGMLVDLCGWNVAEVEDLARLEHCFSPRTEFLGAESPDEDRHQEGRHLIIGDPVGGVFGDDPLQLVGKQCPSVSLALDQFDN